MSVIRVEESLKRLVQLIIDLKQKKLKRMRPRPRKPLRTCILLKARSSAAEPIEPRDKYVRGRVAASDSIILMVVVK